MQEIEIDKEIEIVRTRKLIKFLESVNGNHTSMISLLIKVGDQLNLINNLLTNEIGTANNIRSRVNRLSVINAITSVKEKLKNYTKIPKNGLILYSGTILIENKERQYTSCFEPYKPLKTTLYMCDNKFHTEDLYYLLQDEKTFGFVIVDGNGCLFGTLNGNNKITLHEFSVDLPKKHGRGGQSANRFARLRLEARQNYVRKCCEMITKYFIVAFSPKLINPDEALAKSEETSVIVFNDIFIIFSFLIVDNNEYIFRNLLRNLGESTCSESNIVKMKW